MKRRDIVIGVFLVLVLYLAGNILWSYKGMTVTRYEYQSAKVTEPVRLVLISDLHGNELGKGNARLVKTVRKQQPDVILMAGDFLESTDAERARAAALVSEMSVIAPVYYSLGNHEVDYVAKHGKILLEEMEAAGAVVLEEEYVDVTIGGQKVRIGGMYEYAFALDDWNSTNPETMDPEAYAFLMDFQNTEALKVMMAHRPESFVLGEASKTWEIDLVASGHVHGGQVVLPVLGGLWAVDQGFCPEYETGFHEKDRIHIVITNGLGSGDQLLPRFNNPPEVVVVDVVSE